ncbi:aminotransferase class III-fold pyridoxal phosphate-dependent enzyme [Aeromonas caviae]|uniref:aminotransferase class III-fold pyridoxal phosphate-dependent enzyme n=1 Tax=Aeromonas caviae TaxID=648 RepID=UPI0039A55991
MSHSSNNQQWQARREAAWSGVGTLLPVFIDRAHNAELWDVEGNRYIDFASGIAVLNTGHNHPKVVAAVREQLGSSATPASRSPPTPAISSWRKN